MTIRNRKKKAVSAEKLNKLNYETEIDPLILKREAQSKVIKKLLENMGKNSNGEPFNNEELHSTPTIHFLKDLNLNSLFNFNFHKKPK